MYQHVCPLHTISGCGKERRTLIGPWSPAKAALVRNCLEVYWTCAGGLSAVNAIGTLLRDPINAGLTRCLNKQKDAAAELGRNPVSKHQIQPDYGDEQADAGRDCRTRLARPYSQARTRTGKSHFPCSAAHEQDWQPYLVDPLLFLYGVTIHT